MPSTLENLFFSCLQPGSLRRSIAGVPVVEFFHTQNKGQQQSGTDQNDQIGSKKRHNESEGIVQAISRQKYLDPEDDEKNSQQCQHYMANPEENRGFKYLMIVRKAARKKGPGKPRAVKWARYERSKRE